MMNSAHQSKRCLEYGKKKTGVQDPDHRSASAHGREGCCFVAATGFWLSFCIGLLVH
jgi:hypothetical protein